MTRFGVFFLKELMLNTERFPSPWWCVRLGSIIVSLSFLPHCRSADWLCMDSTVVIEKSTVILMSFSA